MINNIIRSFRYLWSFQIFRKHGFGILLITPLLIICTGLIPMFDRAVITKKFEISLVKFWEELVEGMELPLIPIILYESYTITMRDLAEKVN